MRLIDTSILFRTSPPLQGRPCHAYQRRIPLSTWPPVQHRCGGSLGSAHPRSTNASRVSVILRTCVAQSARKPHLRQYLGRQRRPFRCREMPSSRNCDASAATWGSPRTTSAPLMLSTGLLPGRCELRRGGCLPATARQGRPGRCQAIGP
ncbi:hypothetical protein TcCL_Unassigned03097 [Trypanosoma cruzi]|nr:hypothetical protein TcCL_Unassigned03097 [Trypanosoma cruzi]